MIFGLWIGNFGFANFGGIAVVWPKDAENLFA
jgi:hypothetical protein